MTILEAGLAAPSGCNKQTTSLICVDDPDILTKIHAVIDPPVGETAPALICVLTKRIIAYREEHGPFNSLSELTKVEGIGEKTLENLSQYIKVG